VCWSHSCTVQKVVETIEMLCGGLTLVGPKNNVLHGVKIRTNPLASARGDKSAMQFFSKLLRSLVIISMHFKIKY